MDHTEGFYDVAIEWLEGWSSSVDARGDSVYNTLLFASSFLSLGGGPQLFPLIQNPSRTLFTFSLSM